MKTVLKEMCGKREWVELKGEREREREREDGEGTSDWPGRQAGRRVGRQTEWVRVGGL